ncbi:hypothetical protein AB434_1658 [Heyndrickxia coagulans]|nr:hypothetical protein AB434_1658 [Heyndrickxia coagulans]
MWISHFIIKHLKIDEFTLQNCKMKIRLAFSSMLTPFFAVCFVQAVFLVKDFEQL